MTPTDRKSVGAHYFTAEQICNIVISPLRTSRFAAGGILRERVLLLICRSYLLDDREASGWLAVC